MNAKRIFTAIGFVLVGIGFIKMSIVGYYPREVPLFAGILVAGVVCAFIGHKLPSK
jgi:hypothetical protein